MVGLILNPALTRRLPLPYDILDHGPDNLQVTDNELPGKWQDCKSAYLMHPGRRSTLARRSGVNPGAFTILNFPGI